MSIEARLLEPEIPQELDATYRRTFSRLKGLFRARGCTPEEAADLAQEAAMRAYMHVRRWGVSGEGLDPLINRIARNLLIDRHRRVSPYLVPLENAAEVHDLGADPTEEIIRRQHSREVRTAIGELPDRHQTALVHSMNGLTPAEVADRLGIGRNAADALLHRARRSLRERLRHIGEGSLGIGLWIRMKGRQAASKAGFSAPLEAAGASAIPTAFAAAAMIVAAVNIGGTVPAPARSRPAPAVASAQTGSLPAYLEGSPVTAVPVQPGDSGESITAGPAAIAHDDKSVRTNTEVADPTNPERKLLGVGPDIFYEDGEESTTSNTADRVCNDDTNDCATLYGDPSEKRPVSIKRWR